MSQEIQANQPFVGFPLPPLESSILPSRAAPQSLLSLESQYTNAVYRKSLPTTSSTSRPSQSENLSSSNEEQSFKVRKKSEFYSHLISCELKPQNVRYRSYFVFFYKPRSKNALEKNLENEGKFALKCMRQQFTPEELNGGYLVGNDNVNRSQKRKPLDPERVNTVKGKLK